MSTNTFTITNLKQNPTLANPGMMATFTGMVAFGVGFIVGANITSTLPGNPSDTTNRQGSFTLSFVVPPANQSAKITAAAPGLGSDTVNVTIEVNPVECLHSSSQISIPNGLTQNIINITDGDTIVDASGQCVTVKNAVQCWLGPKIEDKYQPVLVFEKDSLGPGLPHSRLAIDPKHPIALPVEYALHGNVALQPGWQFRKSNSQIQRLHWGDVAKLLPGDNLRYDLVLDDNSCGAYFANGLIIKARQAVQTPGYQYF